MALTPINAPSRRRGPNRLSLLVDSATGVRVLPSVSAARHYGAVPISKLATIVDVFVIYFKELWRLFRIDLVFAGQQPLKYHSPPPSRARRSGKWAAFNNSEREITI